MQFEVPQFIEVEDKIFGPLTFKQFIYLAGGAGAAVAIYFLTNLFFAILIGGPILGLGAALAFYKVNERPFIEVMQSAFNFGIGKKLYLWKKEPKKVEKKEEAPITATPYVPKLSQSKLKDLAWSLDIRESLYNEERPDQRKRT